MDIRRAQYFYPRSPCGERHLVGQMEDKRGPISIHALLAESDLIGNKIAFEVRDFYPRSPCGERPAEQTAREQADKFLSTLSLRRATYTAIIKHLLLKISIHALLAESDPRG